MNLRGFLAALAMFFVAAPAFAAECPSSAVLYYSPECWHSQKLLATLNQMNVKLPMKDVTKDAQAKEELRVKGGIMQVPCLLIDGKPLYNDDDILNWIKANTDCLKKLYGMQSNFRVSEQQGFGFVA